MAEETVLYKKDQDGEWTFTAKSIMVGRMPRGDGNQFKTAIIRIFDVSNPHIKGDFPKKTLEFENIEKVRLRNLTISYYLEGNDIIVNDLTNLKLVKEGTKLQLFADQETVEKR